MPQQHDSDAPELRLLVVEDAEDDAFFLLRRFQDAGYRCHSTRTDNPRDMRQALVTGRWESDRRTRALEEHYRRLRQDYKVTFDTKQPGGPPQ